MGNKSLNLIKLFGGYDFHPVIILPDQYEVFDFANGNNSDRAALNPFGIGKYNEQRPNMYNLDLFLEKGCNQQKRDVHMGIDLGAPEGTPVYAFLDGKIFCKTVNSALGDYGGTLITSHQIKKLRFWVLYGHLRHHSIEDLKKGASFKKGDVIAHVGSKLENGGWPPHVHVQISLIKPNCCDMPGVVSTLDLQMALRIYPDPRLILGQLY